MNSEQYRQEYLKSDAWRALRHEAIKKRGNHCGLCYQPYDPRAHNAMDVHHLNYRNLHDVKPKDLIVVCRACHNMIHALQETGRTFETLTELRKFVDKEGGRSFAKRKRSGSKAFRKRRKIIKSWKPWYPRQHRKPRFVSAQARAEQIGSAIV